MTLTINETRSITTEVEYESAYTNGKRLVLVVQDSYPENPREWDNIGTMVYKHRNYKLGEVEIQGDVCDWLMEFLNLGEKKQNALIKECGGYNNKLLFALMGMLDTHYYWLPTYLYDHSVQSISTRSFNGRAQHAEWDSAMCGFIYLAKKDMKEHGYDAKWLKKNHPGKTMKEVMESYLDGEVKTFDQYIRGDVYGFRSYDIDEQEVDEDGEIDISDHDEQDSCYGFFGDDIYGSGLADHADIACEKDENGRLILKDGWREL